MTNILDTVEPDARIFIEDNSTFGRQRSLYGTEVRKLPMGDNVLYSRETLEPAIERLLAEHRKQVLLEAAELQDKLAYGVAGAGVFPELLRRMAEGEK